MTWLADHWLDVLGWGGSALLVYSLLQASVLRLRVLNAISCVILIVFNAALEVWPMVGTTTVLVAINAYFIVHLPRPGRRSAGSRTSGMLVAPMTMTCPRETKPSIRLRSCATTRFSTSPTTSARLGATASI